MKNLPFQEDDGVTLSNGRMDAVKLVLTDLVEKATQFGFRENKRLSFNYKQTPGTLGKLDEADRIHKSYIPPALFEVFLFQRGNL